MKFKFDEVDMESGGVYDPGAYIVKIKEIESTQASTGNPQLRVKTVVVEGDLKGKPITDHITLVPSCAWKLKKFLLACGLDLGKETVDTESNKFRTMLSRVIGKTTVWVVGQTTRDGVKKNVVNDYQPDLNSDVSDDSPFNPESNDQSNVEWSK